jgi:hypothetical protein
MIATIDNFQFDLSKPIDISIPLSIRMMAIAWYVKPLIEPVRFWGGMEKLSGGMSSTNFNNILLILMVTEHIPKCLGHITSDFYKV